MIFKAWTTGRWAGFSENVIGIVNHRFNPFYAIGEHSFYAYLSGQSHDWRGAFRHGTIATVLTILAVVTAGKGLKSLIKKGGTAGLGAAENAASKSSAAPTRKSTVPRDPKTGNYLPDPDAQGAHTTLGTRQGRHGAYSQGATFNERGEFKGLTDVTNHGRGDHPSPHFHPARGPDSIQHGPHPLPDPMEVLR